MNKILTSFNIVPCRWDYVSWVFGCTPITGFSNGHCHCNATL